MKSLNLTGKFSNERGDVNVNVAVLSFVEDKAHIVYCPALDLSGYGKTETEANKSFGLAVGEYFNYTTHKGSLWTDLKNLGWTIKKNRKKPATPPSMSKLLESNKEFSRIFNNYPYKKFDTGVSLPAYA